LYVNNLFYYVKLQKASSVLALAETNSLIKQLQDSRDMLNFLEDDFLKKKILKQSISDSKELATKKIKYFVELPLFKKYLTVMKFNDNLNSQLIEVDNDLILLNKKVSNCKKKITHIIDNLCFTKVPKVFAEKEV
jgi:hypothetical protein